MLHVAIVSNKDIEVVNSTDGGTRLRELEMIEQLKEGFCQQRFLCSLYQMSSDRTASAAVNRSLLQILDLQDQN